MREYGACLLLLMVCTLFGCNLQDRFVYFPDRSRPSPNDLDEAGLMFWKYQGDDYRGLIDSRPVDDAKGTIIVFHGNAGKAADRGLYARMFRPFGYRVILAEYPGYGGRPGKPGELSFLKAGREMLDLAYRDFGAPIYLAGESLGCGVAAGLAGHTSVPVEGVILFTPWDTLKSVAAEKFPSFLAGIALKDRYDSIENLRAYNKKVAIIGAGRDEIIPVSHARSLYDSYAGQKRMWIIPEAGHNDWPFFMDNSRVRDIINFLNGA